MNKKYSKSHEWVKKDGDFYIIGITEYAAKELGDVVYVEMPSVGTDVELNKSFGVVESVKSVSDLISPVSGKVIEVNSDLENTPELINQSAEETGWILKVKISDEADLEHMIDKSNYDKFIEEEL